MAYTAGGFVLLWSGVKGATVGQTLRALLHGENPSAVSEPPPTVGILDSSSGAAPAAGLTGSASDSAIASDALRYKGHPYLYGGAPGPGGTRPWDCSSFCNWVLGHDMGLTLPGSSSPGYNGQSHGPATTTYLLAWSKYRVKGGASVAVAGNLLVWQTHMGIALGGGQMISALDPALGTRVTTISGGSPTGEVLSVIRVPGT